MNGIQIPSTEIPSGQQDRLSGVRQESLLHPLYRRGGRDFLPRQCGQVRPHNSCGYHYTPKEYFRDNPTVKERLDGHERDGRARSAVRTVPEPRSQKYPFFPLIGWSSPCADTTSTLCTGTSPKWRARRTPAGCSCLYRVGTSRMWGGATVFWQIDRNGNVRARQDYGLQCRDRAPGQGTF